MQQDAAFVTADFNTNLSLGQGPRRACSGWSGWLEEGGCKWAGERRAKHGCGRPGRVRWCARCGAIVFGDPSPTSSQKKKSVDGTTPARHTLSIPPALRLES